MPKVINYDREDRDMREAAEEELKSRREQIQLRDDYYNGHQRKPLKDDAGVDRNVIKNKCDIIVNTTADFVGHRFPEIIAPNTPDLTQAIMAWWEEQGENDFLQEALTDGGIAGHNFARIDLDGDVTLLDARNVIMWWDPENYKATLWYEIQWAPDQYGKNTRRQDIIPFMDDENQVLRDANGDILGWEVIDYVRKGPKWEMMDEPVVWQYPEPPIYQWQHMPVSGKRVYGKPELPDHIIRMQDTINKQSSDINTTLSYYAAPTTVATGVDVSEDAETSQIGAILTIKNENAKVYNVEMQSDLVAMRAERDDHIAGMFRSARIVVMPTNLDAFKGVTNLGIRTVYMTMSNKAETLRRKYGGALVHLTRLWMMINGMPNWKDEPIEIQWSSALPTDEREIVQIQQMELMMGTLTKQMAAEARGREYAMVREQRLNESMDDALLLDGQSAGSI